MNGQFSQLKTTFYLLYLFYSFMIYFFLSIIINELFMDLNASSRQNDAFIGKSMTKEELVTLLFFFFYLLLIFFVVIYIEFYVCTI
uniref:Putative ovule protein n=1 Tax=Solanum chacoense TaxID=4108 RepID=A0A0V0GXN5_SOLCH